MRRAQELTKAKLVVTNGQAEPLSQPAPAQPDTPIAPLPEAPVSITLKATLHGHEVAAALPGPAVQDDDRMARSSFLDEELGVSDVDELTHPGRPTSRAP